MKTIKDVLIYLLWNIYDFGVFIFFLKKLAHAYLVRQYFSKSFGGKIKPN